MLATRVSASMASTRMRTGGGSAIACPLLRPNAVRTLFRIASRDISVFSTVRESSSPGRAAGPRGSARARMAADSSPRARCAATCHFPKAPRSRPPSPPFHRGADGTSPTPDLERQPLQAVLAATLLGLLHLRAQFQQHPGNVDLHRTHFRARAAQARRERQARLVPDGPETRGNKL